MVLHLQKMTLVNMMSIQLANNLLTSHIVGELSLSMEFNLVLSFEKKILKWVNIVASIIRVELYWFEALLKVVFILNLFLIIFELKLLKLPFIFIYFIVLFRFF